MRDAPRVRDQPDNVPRRMDAGVAPVILAFVALVRELGLDGF